MIKSDAEKNKKGPRSNIQQKKKENENRRKEEKRREQVKKKKKKNKDETKGEKEKTLEMEKTAVRVLCWDNFFL